MTSGRPPEMGVAFFYLYVILFNLGGFMKDDGEKPSFWSMCWWIFVAAISISFIRGIGDDYD